MNRVVLVGAGCGADSVTVRGARLLQMCDCVVYDSLLDESVFGFLRGDCVRIFVGKRAGAHAASQEEINAILCGCAKKYPLTVRLKGGDPFVFGRGGEELAALAAQGISCGVVPGVTSAVAAAELAGIPVTHRAAARGFRVYTAHTADGTFSVPSPAADETLVFLMAKANADAVAKTLFEGGMSEDTPAALLSKAGMVGARAVRCTLGEVAARAAELDAPLTLVVGKVCAEDLLGASFARHFSAPAVLVTGNGVGIAAETATAASESAIVVATVHRTDAAAALHPFLSFPREAVPDANVIAITGIAMHTPRFTMNEEAALSTLSADGSSPKISAVANPMRSAAIYVIHVFMELSLQHHFPRVNYQRSSKGADRAYIRSLILSPT